MKKIEFYNSPDGTVNYHVPGEPVKALNESCKDIIQDILYKIRELYPDAYDALSLIYSNSQMNKSYFEYKIVHRFIRCNFGEYDSLTSDLDNAGNMNIENVKCPLRGECKHEGIICMPKMKTSLSPRELDVVKLLVQGFDRLAISEELKMSPYTVNRHFANIRSRIGAKSTAQIIAHFRHEIK